ncbi:MAG: tripartite tricarboxylate transporter permease [Xanthobacteraceae bacterium]
MELLANLAKGFEAALAPEPLLFCFIGVTIGTFVGALPGVGAMAAVAICLPITFYLDPMVALIMLAGIFYGAQYGSSIASILLNIPGTVTAAVTCLDGYPLTKQGRAGPALFITTITSFVGGSIAILLLMCFAPLIAAFALRFSSAEYFSIMLLGLVAGSTLALGSPLKGLAMVVLGVALGIVGTDINTGMSRFTFGVLDLRDGLNLVAVAMGLFGVAEILASVGRGRTVVVDPKSINMRSLIPTRQDIRESIMPTLRGTAVGSAIGALPGSGAVIATFMSYALEKRVSRNPAKFGRGAIEGIAAPEAANNAAVQAAFIPTLSLGIPGDALTAVLLGAMMIHGIVPGPQFITEHAVTFWGLVASFWIGNVLLLVLNIPLIGIWVRLLAIPYHLLYPATLFFICIGVYAINNNVFDIYTAIAFGAIGYLMSSYQYPAAPLLLGFILGPMMEEHLKRALLISQGDFMVFLQRPISLTFLLVTTLLLLLAARPFFKSALARTRAAQL